MRDWGLPRETLYSAHLIKVPYLVASFLGWIGFVDQVRCLAVACSKIDLYSIDYTKRGIEEEWREDLLSVEESSYLTHAHGRKKRQCWRQ